ncbi:MAG TPA: hypothetical protein VK919_00010 [Solirubrobacterales bacterium]|nr:hypothetical protein [Solirubrobacterales bacterium]
MTRTSSILSPVLVMLAALVAVAPASAADGYRSADAVFADQPAADGYRSADAVLAGGGPTETTAVSDYRSADAVLAGGGPTEATAVSDYRSADAVLAGGSPPQASQERASGRGYVDALLRSPATPQPPPVPLVTPRGGEGFHWDDALVGALMTSILVLLMLAAARSVARHRRASAESRA